MAELARRSSGTRTSPGTTQILVFGGMFMGFGIKVPMFPFHTWLPDAHTQAPTQGSVILAAVLLKLGTYGFIRVALPILPEAAEAWAPWIGLLAVIGIIYGALGCLAQTDMKRLIAFSSVAHMGFVMLGISTLTDFGLNAAVFGMVAHGLITGMLFFIAGSVKERYHTLEISASAVCSSRHPAWAGSSASARWPRSACPAWPASGASSRPSWPPTSRPTASPVETFRRLHGRRRRSAPCSPPATCSGSTSAPRSARPRDEFDDEHIHDVGAPSGSPGRRCSSLILVLGVYPNLDLQGHRRLDHHRGPASSSRGR